MTPPSPSGRVLLLSGGVGGARLARGLAQALPDPAFLSVAVNTADDFTHLGLAICPDLDTVLYTLAGLENPEQGWGRADETWSFMAALAKLGGETWFRLGDKDLALHVFRTRALAEGRALSDVTADAARILEVAAEILPMSDDIFDELEKAVSRQSIVAATARAADIVSGEYVKDDRELLFCLRRTLPPSPPREDRFYFHQGRLIRWLDGRKRDVSPSDPTYAAEAKKALLPTTRRLSIADRPEAEIDGESPEYP